MQRLALSCLSALLLVSLAACDKSKDAKSDDKKAAAKTDDKPADKPADEAKPEAEAEPAVDPNYVDDTKGLGMVVREVAVDTGKPEVDASKAPKYDTSKDEGGLIGHIATALAHDEELEGADTTKELLKLSGEDGEPGPSDGMICNHVWTDIFSKAYPTKTDADDTFIDACKLEVERARVKLGAEIFAQHAACVMAAADLAALDLCDSAEQTAELWLHANPHGDGPDEKLCSSGVEQMFILITRDMADPDLLEELEEDIYGIKDDAKIVCADEGTKAEIACIMKAAKLVDLEGCRTPAEAAG